MIRNRSVPAHALLPHIYYPDVSEAIVWLSRTLGFVEHYRYGASAGDIDGAQMHLGDAWIMLTRARPGGASPMQAGCRTQSLTIFVADVDGHFRQSRAMGARIVRELRETVYGERLYSVEDLAGHHWEFSSHVRDLNPEQWGAVVAWPAALSPQISPMLAVSDGSAAVAFYEAAFGATLLWRLGEGADTIAGLSVDGAEFFLAPESPDHGTRGPASAGFTTVRVELFAEDPVTVHRRALEAGAKELSPVVEHQHAIVGPRPIRRMLQGALRDPFGHMWLVGRFLD